MVEDTSVRNSGNDRHGDVAGTGEFKAVAHEALRLGARALDRGRAWLNQTWSNDDRSEDMTQRQGPGGRETQAQRRRGGEDESWMHDKQRQAARTGDADYAYDPARGHDRERGREYGHASADDRGRGGGYAREYGADYDADYGADHGAHYRRDNGEGYVAGYRERDGSDPGAGRGPRMDRDYGGRDDGAPGREREPRAMQSRQPGERGLYGAYGPGVPLRGRRGGEYDDSGWRAGGFDERSQSVGWEDDRGDAPGGSPHQGDPRHGYYVYGGESRGRERPHGYDEFDPRRARHGEDFRAGSRRMGEGYGRSSGYADAGGEVAGSAYGAGFEPNREWSRERAEDVQSAYREQGARNHRGRGPRSYARSDQRIEEDLNERLTEDALIDASDIEVVCQQGVVVLSGEVDDRWMKHRAEDIADACGGVKDVDNRIRVRGRDHAVLAAGPESGGRRENAGRFGQATAAQGSQAQAPSTQSSSAQANAGRSAGAGTAAGTDAGTSGSASPSSGSTQPH